MTTILFLVLAFTCHTWGMRMLISRGRGKFRLGFIAMTATVAVGGFVASAVAEKLYPVLYSGPAEAILSILPQTLAVSILAAFVSIPVLRTVNPLGTIDPVIPAAVLALILSSSAMGFLGWRDVGNALFDTSAATPLAATVVQKMDGWNRSGPSRILALEIEEKTGRLTVSEQFFNSVQIGEPVLLHIRPGAHGVTWVERIAKEK